MRRSSSTSNVWGWGALLLLVAMVSRSSSSAKRRPRDVHWSDDDMRAFKSAVEASGVPLDVALQVYASESGLDPAASAGTAWGLPQFIESTLRGLGWKDAPSRFAQLSVAQQAPWIGRLLKSQVAYLGYVPQTAVELYAVNFWPAAAKRREDVILVRDSQDARERRAYAANAGLDRARKGWIAREDLQVSLNRVSKLPALERARAQARRLAA